MLEISRQRAETEGFAPRCYFHEGYLDSLPVLEPHDAATCFLVSQFILEQEARTEFFSAIANRLRPSGWLASSDLAAGADDFPSLLEAWGNLMSGAPVTPEKLAQMRDAYAKDVAILSPAAVASIIKAGGFETSVQFFQTALLHGWISKRTSDNAA
jgi:tRNA (cmo5U34)-methyltransferase